ncbi:MAG: Helix-turn-helix domain [Microbacterium sp.]|jgi:transcriptional regulator with XRE-family HTH domain|nr:Helix-turn-helix domain [Microbacterium sp.]
MTEFDDVQMAGPRLAVKISELIRLAVRESKFSQREIADRMGISESRLSQITHGDGNFHTATIARVFAAAGCTFDFHVFTDAGHEIEIPRRGRRSRAATPAVYLHSVQTADGEVQNVVSYAPRTVVGSPIDFPLQAASVSEARKLADVQYEFEFEVDLVKS